MATKLKEVDAVVVGLGWTGGILSKELTEAGLKVVALERGSMCTPEDFAVPCVRDELTHVHRHKLMQNVARDTLTVRNNIKREALPMRRLGSFPPGEGVGGSAVHWSGGTWRWTGMEFKVRTMYEERYGKNFIPADMTIQDWGITYAELAPYYDRFEKTAGVSGKAGNLKGVVQPGGNPFEAPRQNEYPLPPLRSILSAEMFNKATRDLGYHPFPRPNANASQAYTNPDGSKFGACQYCGFCQRFGCEATSLLSGIGQPYDPVSQKGVIGKNYSYQNGVAARLFFEGRNFNPFRAAGGSSDLIDDFNANWNFDRGPVGALGGYNISAGFNTALPIGYRPVPPGTPAWGKEWKAATAKW